MADIVHIHMLQTCVGIEDYFVYFDRIADKRCVASVKGVAHTHFIDLLAIYAEAHMSLTLNGSSVI